MSWYKNIRQNPKEFFDSFKTIAIAILVALVFRYSVAAPYKIPSGSMIPTLKIGDFIFVSKLSYGLKLPFSNYNLVAFNPPKRGEVIVFVYPEDTSLDFIKRVVAVEGDTVEVKDNVLFINGNAMERTPVKDQSILSDVSLKVPRAAAKLYQERINPVNHFVLDMFPLPSNFGPVTVPPGNLFVMGDNRDDSRDSRFWGFLPVKNVRGRALFVWLSLDGDHWRIRWERFGMKII